MSPIEQIKPALPSNWTRRPENRNKRVEPGTGKDKDSEDRRRDHPGDKSPSGHGSGDGPDDGTGGREHIVDELA